MVVTWLMMISSVFAEVCEVDFHYMRGCDLTYGNDLEAFGTVRSITECSYHCHQNDRCLSFKYDLVKKTSALNAERYMTLSTDCPVLLIYAELIKHSCRKLINEHCTEASECSVTNSQCFMNNCQCDPGYSYKHVDESCVTSCDVYGPTFTTYFGYTLFGLNDESLTNIATGEACLQACANRISYVCRSTDFHPSSQKCYLSKNTAQTDQDQYLPDTNYYYFNRNCQ